MNLNPTQCCALTEIAGLSNHKNPLDAMKGFCKELIKMGGTGSGPLLVPGHIIFTGVVRYSRYDGPIPTYGPDFAAFIKKNRLGTVVEGAEGPNRLNHPTHIVRVWVWTPAPTTLNNWWKKHKGGK